MYFLYLLHSIKIHLSFSTISYNNSTTSQTHILFKPPQKTISTSTVHTITASILFYVHLAPRTPLISFSLCIFRKLCIFFNFLACYLPMPILSTFHTINLITCLTLKISFLHTHLETQNTHNLVSDNKTPYPYVFQQNASK